MTAIRRHLAPAFALIGLALLLAPVASAAQSPNIPAEAQLRIRQVLGQARQILLTPDGSNMQRVDETLQLTGLCIVRGLIYGMPLDPAINLCGTLTQFATSRPADIDVGVEQVVQIESRIRAMVDGFDQRPNLDVDTLTFQAGVLRSVRACVKDGVEDGLSSRDALEGCVAVIAPLLEKREILIGGS
jgi:hypothetical protein